MSAAPTSTPPTPLRAVPSRPARVHPGEFVPDDPQVPPGLLHAVAGEIGEAATTVAEDVEQIVEGAVGELLAGAAATRDLLRDALRELAGRGVTDLPHTVLAVTGGTLAAMAGETLRRGGAVAGTATVAGRHAAARMATAALRVATGDPSGRRF